MMDQGMRRSPPISNTATAGQLSLGNAVEAEGGLHLPAYLAADGLISAQDIPAVGAVVVAPGPVHDALQVEVVPAAGPHCYLVLQADRALDTNRELCLLWNPDCGKNVNDVALERRRGWSEELAG